eukprot:scpid110426/ scgid4515/ 
MEIPPLGASLKDVGSGTETRSLPVADQVAAVSVSERASAYHQALRKHFTAVKSCSDIDVVDCVESLRAEGHITDASVVEIRDIHESAGEKKALDRMCVTLEKLTPDAMCYVVEEILLSQGLSQLVETFRVC